MYHAKTRSGATIVSHAILLCLLIFFTGSQAIAFQSSAEDTTSRGRTMNVSEDTVKTIEPFSVSGYFDTYYFTNLNNPSTRNNLGSSGISRGFDRYVDQFQLGMFMLRMNYTTSKLDFVGELGFGPNVEYGSYGNDFRYKWGSVLANSTYTALMIKQAYISYKITGKLTATMGQFGTHIGYEYIDAPLNFNYSINNTFNAGIPFYHTGLKATYVLSDKISVMAGIVNGTDNTNDNNRGKSFIGQVAFTPTKKLSVYINTIQGNEANARINGTDTSSYFGVWDLVASYQATKKMKIGIWTMLGSARGEFQGGSYFVNTKHWSGANLYVSYDISSIFAVGARLEYFDNTSGARALLTQGNGTDVKSLTITWNFSLADNKLLLKPEFRIDQFKRFGEPGSGENVQQFMDSNGNFSKNSQSTIGMAAIFKFDTKK